MDKTKPLSYNLEYIFLQKIINGLRSKEYTLAQAKQHAIDFLKIEPLDTPEDAYIKIMEFVASHPDFSELKSFMNDYQIKRADLAKIEMMRQYIKKKDINSALKIAKS